MIKEQSIYYSPISYQARFHHSRAYKVLLSAGYGAGKTYSLCMKLFHLMSENQGLAGGIVAPTLKMFKRDVLPTIKEICAENGISYTYNKTDNFFEFHHTGSTVYIFHGEDDGESIRGPNLAFMLINEVTLITKPTYDAAIARVRIKKAPLRQIAMSGTPEGFNWVYDHFILNPREDTEVIYGDMRQNIHIADTYAQELIGSYDKLMVEQFVEGKFVNLTGNRAVYAFDRRKDCDDTLKKEKYRPIWVNMDFNINPMAATLWHPMPRITGGPWLLGFDEICLTGRSNTYEMARALRGKLDPEDEVVIFPDPAGASGSTKSDIGVSDIQILQDAGFKDIRYKSKISVKDCLNAANNLFDKRRVKINSKTCPQTVADFEQCVLKNGTWEIDKSNSKRTHWLDGFKDMADYEFPIVRSGVAREYQIR